MVDVREIAQDYAALVAAGLMDQAAMKYWSDDLVTTEAVPGQWGRTSGKDEAISKAEWWVANNEVHGVRSEGPFVNGDQFLLLLDLDVTPKDGERTHRREVVCYRVARGKVVEERYFY